MKIGKGDIMKDWKTTVPGLIAAIVTAVMPVAPAAWLPYLAIINAAALGALGFFAKQTNGRAQ